MLAANLAAFIALKRANPRLNRDVIFLATADEEQFGDASVKILIAKYWDKFAAGFALNEGGEVLLKNGKVQYVAVQASEKVPVNVTVVARGTSGHASMPTKDNAVVHLAAAVAKIGNYSVPVHFTTIVRRYFEQLAAIEDDEIGKWMRSLDAPDRGEHAQRVISDASPLWNSMLRDSIAPTMLAAGVRANVIPGEARANLNIRLLPGDTIDVLLAELKKLVNDPQIRFELQPDAGLAAPPSSLENDFYATITKVAGREFSGAPVLPFQSTGATDSAQLRLHNVQSYGFLPFAADDRSPVERGYGRGAAQFFAWDARGACEEHLDAANGGHRARKADCDSCRSSGTENPDRTLGGRRAGAAAQRAKVRDHDREDSGRFDAGEYSFHAATA